MPTAEEIRERFTELKVNERFDKLVAVGEKPGREAAQQRGRDFEALLLDLLDVHGLLLRRSYHTADNSSEQIDGAIRIAGRVALVEAKWVESGLAASELFAFLGKVEGKFVGTIGLFVSYIELSPNFIQALRAGRRQSVLVVHGAADLERVFDPAFPLREYLEECVSHVSIDNAPHLSADAFTSRQARDQRAEQASKKGDLLKLLQQLDSPAASAKALAEAEGSERLEPNVHNLLTVFPRVLVRASPEPLRSQIPKYVETAAKRLATKELPIDVEYFRGVFPATILDSSYLAIVTALAPRLQFVSKETRDVSERVLIAAWEEHLGTYDKENILAKVTEVVWPYLGEAPKRKLLGWFIHFVNSDRRPYFPQMQIARRHLTDDADAKLRDEALRELLVSEFTSMLKRDDADLAWARKWIEHSFENTITMWPSDVKSIVDDVQKEFAATGEYK